MPIKDDFGNNSNIKDFFSSYTNNLLQGIKSIDFEVFKKIVSILENASINKNKILTIGNGGSNAIADHLCCDFTKGTHKESFQDLRSFSLGSNSALTTAIANDIGYEFIFSNQIRSYGSKNDILIAISSSGNSQNILNALDMAKKLEMITIGFCGFSGGEMLKKVNYCLYTPVNNYGIVEDCHQSLMHIIAQIIRMRREQLIDW